MTVKRMGLWGAMMLVAGNMVGSGLYMLPADLAKRGSITTVSWLVAGLGAMALAVVYANLSRLRPHVDAVDGYPAQALHPSLGHMSWFVYWIACWVGLAGIAVVATGYLAFFIPVLKGPLAGVLCSLAIVWACVLLVYIGPRLVGRTAGLTFILGIIPIALTVAVGLFAFNPHLFTASWNVSGKPDLIAVNSAVAPVFWGFLGVESANIVASVVDNPQRNVPLAAVGGAAIALVVYLAASTAIFGIAPASALSASSAPFADAIQAVAGAGAAALVAACALAKTFGTLAGWTLVAAETNRAGALAGHMPRLLSTTDPGRRPARDLILIGVLVSGALLASVSGSIAAQFAVLINITVILSLLFYVLGSLSLLRWFREPDGAGPRALCLAAALIATVFCGWLILTMDPAYRLPVLATLALSVVLYGVTLLTRRRAPAAAQ